MEKEENAIKVSWNEDGQKMYALYPKDIYKKFNLIYCIWCEIARKTEEIMGEKPKGYQLEDWFINKKLED